MDAVLNAKRELLRHTVATLAYRGGKAVRQTPPAFATFRAGESTRTPEKIVAHLGDLFDWAMSLAQGAPAWQNSTPLPWEQEVERFFNTLKQFDDYLVSAAPLACSAEKLFQGPIADALTHVGQLTLLRRLFNAPIRSENYFKAEIVAGRVGAAQVAPKFEFD